ncbi:MAG TPA: glycolate oxidase subunit GlcF [Rhodospirillales bacterium]|nr:glycolate oxidase subunit GlcF [Rhodospirillales bacterium]
MQTGFRAELLRDPDMRESERILRACVHCGFCTATCPTYVLLGDELDSPRGRIYLIKNMLESGRPASPQVVRHLDRCLSCLSCMTTCPSGVHYMHLVDHARSYVERTYRRPAADRWLRALLATVLPRPFLFRLALIGAGLVRPLAPLFGGRLGAMLGLAPRKLPPPSPVDRPRTFPAEGRRRARVALLSGCAQQVIAPEINEATIRLLTRMGVEVVVARGAVCCGALTHHMGKTAAAHATAAATIEAWWREHRREPLDFVVVNASGCGTTVKDYGFMFREDAAMAEKAATIASLARDVSEVIGELGLPEPVRRPGLVVAYHAACSMQHGQKITTLPKRLLADAGFEVRDVPEGHLCCGSAGTYNLLQPEIASRLKARKLAAIESLRPEVIASGNIGCNTQIASGTAIPVCHTVELLDWATGGPPPAALPAGLAAREAPEKAPVREPAVPG